MEAGPRQPRVRKAEKALRRARKELRRLRARGAREYVAGIQHAIKRDRDKWEQLRTGALSVLSLFAGTFLGKHLAEPLQEMLRAGAVPGPWAAASPPPTESVPFKDLAEATDALAAVHGEDGAKVILNTLLFAASSCDPPPPVQETLSAARDAFAASCGEYMALLVLSVILDAPLRPGSFLEAEVERRRAGRADREPAPATAPEPPGAPEPRHVPSAP